MITNAELKKRARDALLDHWPDAILVVLITLLLPLLSQMYGIFTGVDSTQQFLQFVSDLTGGRSLRQALITLSAAESADNPLNLLDLAAQVIMPMLSLGCIRFMLMRLRREDGASVDTVLSYKEYFWPAFKLNFLVGLRILGWMLLGILIALIGMVQVENGEPIGFLVGFGGLGVMFALLVWASCRYGMAMYFMAENPEMSCKDCIQCSLDMMVHRKLQLFMLDLSFILFDLGILLVQMLLSGILGSMMAAVLGIALHLPVQTYREAAAAAFFLAFRPEQERTETTETSMPERWKQASMTEVNDRGNEL